MIKDQVALEPLSPSAALAARLQSTLAELTGSIMSPSGVDVDCVAPWEGKAYADYQQERLAALRQFGPHGLSSLEASRAFWINLYNALVLDAIIRFGVQKSVTEIFLGVLTFFRRVAYLVGGCRMSLEDIEHGILSGNRSISWSRSDSDGNTLVYQLQYSNNGGATFTPLTFLGTENSFLLDSSALPSGDLQIRVIASDGFNTSFAVRNVTADNSLRLLGVTPADGAGAVGVNSTATVAFVSDVNPATLQAGSFTMRNAASQAVTSEVIYNEISRVATFTPLFQPAHDMGYTAILASTVADVHGNTLCSQVTWSFTTGPDDTPQVVWKVSPVPGAPEEPRNALVQVRFREAMNAGSLTGSALQLLDQNGAGRRNGHLQRPALGGALYPAAGGVDRERVWVGRRRACGRSDANVICVQLGVVSSVVGDDRAPS